MYRFDSVFLLCFLIITDIHCLLLIFLVQVPLNDNSNRESSYSNTPTTNSSEMLDNQEIDDTLDEFSKILSDYSCDGNPAGPAMQSAAQMRLESLFVPPDRAVSNSSHGPRQVSASAAKDNPGMSSATAEDEASIR